jgi:rubredoxin
VVYNRHPLCIFGSAASKKTDGKKRAMPELVTIATYTDALMAHVARSRLESEGLLCFLADEHLIGMDWMYSNAVGGVKLQVRAEDARAARELLREGAAPEGLPDPTAGAETDDMEPDSVCPHCGGTSVVHKNFTRVSAAFSLVCSLIFFLPLFFFRKHHRCKACGHTWREP